MTRILVDTNLFLDTLFDRAGLAGESQAVLDWCESGRGDGWIAWHTLANLYYIGTKAVGRTKALRQIDAILAVFEVCPTGSRSALEARRLPVDDFEYALQIAAATAVGAQFIVTRNVIDFTNSPIATLDPETFCDRIRAWG